VLGTTRVHARVGAIFHSQLFPGVGVETGPGFQRFQVYEPDREELTAVLLYEAFS
jgi:hypothetical protein